MRKSHPQQIRIISGSWRGRKIDVPDADTLRPTKDYIRETLFNWLQPIIEGSHCLDAFAGSGVLGFEAASRGAAHVVMLEKSHSVCENLRNQAARLQANQIEIINTPAEHYLANTTETFDIVFLDPPFQDTLLTQSCELLSMQHCLKSGFRIYLETARAQEWPQLPSGWQLIRDKTSGDVRFGLAAEATE